MTLTELTAAAEAGTMTIISTRVHKVHLNGGRRRKPVWTAEVAFTIDGDDHPFASCGDGPFVTKAEAEDYAEAFLIDVHNHIGTNPAWHVVRNYVLRGAVSAKEMN